MVDDSLLDRDTLGFAEWSVTPSASDLTPNSVELERETERVRSRLRRGASEVIISHTDADGYTSAALLLEQSIRESVIITVEYQSGYQLKHALNDIASVGSKRVEKVYIADLNPDDDSCAKQLQTLTDAGIEVEWFDHHQWGGKAPQYGEVCDLTIDTNECAASLIEREIDYAWGEQFHELVEVTKDRDLWINDDPRSERLSVLSRVTSADGYINTVIENGVDFPDLVDEKIDERIERDKQLEEKAVLRAESHSLGPDFTAAFTYTSGGNTSNIGNELVEDHDPLYDLAIVCTPTSVSYYSHSESGNFDHCHEIAGKLGGGGHPTAAGSGVPADDFRELAHWWSMMGQDGHVKTVILNAAADVVQSE